MDHGEDNTIIIKQARDTEGISKHHRILVEVWGEGNISFETWPRYQVGTNGVHQTMQNTEIPLHYL